MFKNKDKQDIFSNMIYSNIYIEQYYKHNIVAHSEQHWDKSWENFGTLFIFPFFSHFEEK